MSQKLNDYERMRYEYLSHSSNASKTDEEFREWQELNRKVGAPVSKEEHRYKLIEQCMIYLVKAINKVIIYGKRFKISS